MRKIEVIDIVADRLQEVIQEYTDNGYALRAMTNRNEQHFESPFNDKIVNTVIFTCILEKT